MTSVGPHRDDLLFSIGEVDIRKFGSQGQQRTSALSLKLSEIELVKRSIHDTPVLLLDDVLSELDSNRQNYLLNSIHDTQTLITCTGLDEFVKIDFRSIRYLKLYRGLWKREKKYNCIVHIFLCAEWRNKWVQKTNMVETRSRFGRT